MEPIARLVMLFSWFVWSVIVAGIVSGACLLSWGLEIRAGMRRQTSAINSMLARERQLLEALEKRENLHFNPGGQDEFSRLLRSFDRSHPEVAAAIEEEIKWTTT